MPKSQKGFIAIHFVLLILAISVGAVIFGIYKFGYLDNFLSKYNPEIYYKNGLGSLLKGKDYMAAAQFHNYLEKKRSLDNKKKFIIGATFAKTGRYYQAINLLKDASPDESDATRIFYKTDYYNLLAESYLHKRKFDLALQTVDRTLQIQNAAPEAIRRAHIIKFLIYEETGDKENAKKEKETLGSLEFEDLDIFQQEFYGNRSLDYAQVSGLLDNVIYTSLDSISKNQKLSPAKRAIIFTIMAALKSQKGELDEAVVFAKKAMEEDPDNILGYYEMGNIQSNRGKFDTALEYHQKALKIDPTHPLILTGIGWDYYNLAVSQGVGGGYIIKEMGLAEESYIKALKVDPEFAIAQNNLGLVYFDRNQCDKATERFNLSAKYDPTYQKPVNNLGATYFQSQDYDKALEYFTQSLEIDPNYARAFLNIGRAYYYMGDFQKSLEALKKDLTLDPYDTDAYLFIAKNYLEMEKSQEAIEILNKAIEITPDYPKLYFALNDAYVESGDLTKSREAYEQAMKLFLQFGDEYMYYYNRGVEYKRDNKIDQAIEAFNKAIELQADYTNSYIPLSRIYESKYGTDKSIELLEKGLKSAPDSLQIYDELGYIYKDNNDLDNALKIFQEAIYKIQGNCDKVAVARIYEGLGLVYYDMKKFDLALDAFSKSWEQDPYSSTIYTNLAAAIAKSDQKKAKEILLLIKTFIPNDAVAHNNLGDILAQEGKINEAIIEFKRALEIDPNLKIAKENLEKYQRK